MGYDGRGLCKWEYRIFFRPVPGAGPVFTSKSQASVEERKDVYHPHSAAVGVKERGVGSGSLTPAARLPAATIAPRGAAQPL